MRMSDNIFIILSLTLLVNFHEFYLNVAIAYGDVIEIPVSQTESYSPNNKISFDKPNFNNQKQLLKTYIVHVLQEKKPISFLTGKEWHISILASITNTINIFQPRRYDLNNSRIGNIKDRLLYSYTNVIEGFAVSLTKEEAMELDRKEEVTMLLEDTIYELQTTRTPTFLGTYTTLDNVRVGRLFEAANGGSDVIIGVLDSGVWPERQSFANDIGFSPIPKRWKGRCDNVKTFQGERLCNRKLIGARAFYKGVEAIFKGYISSKLHDYSRSPRDREGHGTHVASIAVGNPVSNASLFGYAHGTASGVAPNARLAMYKVCWHMVGCPSIDILASFDIAISDGVDVISISITSRRDHKLGYLSEINRGTFVATTRGIICVAIAGNDGPTTLTVKNTAPWILTIGASTIDRDFPATLTLGNGLTFQGLARPSGFEVTTSNIAWPLVDGGNCLYPNFAIMRNAVVICSDDTNKYVDVKSSLVNLAGGKGMIYVVKNKDLTPQVNREGALRLTMVVGLKVGEAIHEYISTQRSPTVKLGLKLGNTRIGFQEAPSVAQFSSRGPNQVTWEVLKPDIIAPGVDILASWNNDNLWNDDSLEFNIATGTSMAAPHVAGVVALLRATRPMWSPAMIKSAIITTAYTINNRGNHILDLSNGNNSNPIAMGAGHVNPNAALDPGLVYNSNTQDYIDFLCSIGYDSNMIQTISNASTLSSNCNLPTRSRGDINYPSFSIMYLKSQAQVGGPINFTFSRTLTNVNSLPSSYYVKIIPPQNVHVNVKPNVLSFQSLYQEVPYFVTFSPNPSTFDNMSNKHRVSAGSIIWEDKEGDSEHGGDTLHGGRRIRYSYTLTCDEQNNWKT